MKRPHCFDREPTLADLLSALEQDASRDLGAILELLEPERPSMLSDGELGEDTDTDTDTDFDNPRSNA